MFIQSRSATQNQQTAHGATTALGAYSGSFAGFDHPRRAGLRTVFAALLVSAAAHCVAQDGLAMLPPEAREAGAAYRKMMAADNNGAKSSAAERANYEPAETPRTRCSEATRQFCSDLANAQFEFKPFKALLPDVPRLTPHNVYIRRNKITVAYTFK